MTDSVKASRTSVQIGSLVVDGFMLPDGSYRMSLTQAAECVGLAVQNASDFLRSKAIKSLLGEAYTPQIFEIDATDQARGQSRFRALSLEAVTAYWQWQSHRGNKQALALCMALTLETLERRFDSAFGVTRSEQEYNELLAERMKLAQDLQRLGEAYALDDVIRQERDRFEGLLREHGIDPWAPPNDKSIEEQSP